MDMFDINCGIPRCFNLTFVTFCQMQIVFVNILFFDVMILCALPKSEYPGGELDVNCNSHDNFSWTSYVRM